MVIKVEANGKPVPLFSESGGALVQATKMQVTALVDDVDDLATITIADVGSTAYVRNESPGSHSYCKKPTGWVTIVGTPPVSDG